MDVEAVDVDEAKQIYSQVKEYDFAGAAAGEYPGSWYYICEDGVEVDGYTSDMPN